MAPKLVHLYPLPDAFIPDVLAQECEVTEEEAARLLAYSPPAFSTNRPPGPKAPQQPEGPEKSGPSDLEAK